jgi:hypothetical protein
MGQTLIVAAVVLLALVFVGRRAWAALRPARDAGCASGCGCGTEGARPDGDWAKT